MGLELAQPYKVSISLAVYFLLLTWSYSPYSALTYYFSSPTITKLISAHTSLHSCHLDFITYYIIQCFCTFINRKWGCLKLLTVEFLHSLFFWALNYASSLWFTSKNNPTDSHMYFLRWCFVQIWKLFPTGKMKMPQSVLSKFNWWMHQMSAQNSATLKCKMQYYLYAVYSDLIS